MPLRLYHSLLHSCLLQKHNHSCFQYRRSRPPYAAYLIPDQRSYVAPRHPSPTPASASNANVLCPGAQPAAVSQTTHRGSSTDAVIARGHRRSPSKCAARPPGLALLRRVQQPAMRRAAGSCPPAPSIHLSFAHTPHHRSCAATRCARRVLPCTYNGSMDPPRPATCAARRVSGCNSFYQIPRAVPPMTPASKQKDWGSRDLQVLCLISSRLVQGPRRFSAPCPTSTCSPHNFDTL